MRLCFVIMPIGSGDAYEVYLNRYTNIIKPAVEGYLKGGSRVFDAVRADFITKTGSINKSVIQHIYNADLVIADLTDLNPNVFYELGVRHALRNGTILVALDGTKLPFDVGDLRSVFYKDRVGAEKEAVPEIQRLIRALAEAESPDDSPVFAVLPALQAPQMRDLSEAKARTSAAETDAAELRVKLSLAEEANLRLRESFTTFERTINAVLDRLKPKDREAAAYAVDRAVKARSEQPRRAPRQLPGVEEISTDVFVLMPFREELEPIYQIIKDAGQRAGLRIMRADEFVAPGQITAQISEAIARAGLIVADITGQNPNVLFEVGMATSLGKDILIISQDRAGIPFDIKDQRVIFYENTIRGAEHLREQLTIAMTKFAKRAG
jgi:nucleoside 2-deoxyribosyltransferase